jgi:hypothetical protein
MARCVVMHSDNFMFYKSVNIFTVAHIHYRVFCVPRRTKIVKITDISKDLLPPS